MRGEKSLEERMCGGIDASFPVKCEVQRQIVTFTAIKLTVS